MLQNLSPTSIAGTPTKRERPKGHKRRTEQRQQNIPPSSSFPLTHQYHYDEFRPSSSTTPTPHQIAMICGHRCPRSKKNQGHTERYGDTVSTIKKSSFGSQ